MYSLVKIAAKYIHYFLTASNGRGHGVHSPFVFDFIENVLTDKRHFYAYDSVEGVRKKMITDERVLTIEDFGAGSTATRGNQRKVSSIARTSLKPTKYGQLLFRMVNYYKPTTIIELGTSLGVTTAYVAAANNEAQVYTFEGAGEVAAVAQENLSQLQVENVRLVKGNFDNTLQRQLEEIKQVDFAFVDGNHRKEPTLAYFEMLLQKAGDNSILVFDDIHWSWPMEEAWQQIISHPRVTLSIDLFFIGLVFFRPQQKRVQHFKVRY